MSTSFQFSLRRLFLYVHVVAVACSAFVGIGQILTGSDDDFRVLLTAITVALASVCGLACGAALESKRRPWIIPGAGLALTLVAALLVIVLIWSQPAGGGETLIRVTAITAVFAVACTHVSLLFIARLAQRFKWALILAVFSIFAVAILISWPILVDDSPSDWLIRWIAVAAIGDATMSVLVPVFHVLSRSEYRATSAPNPAEIDAEIARLEQRLVELRTLRKAACGNDSTQEHPGLVPETPRT